MTDLRTRIDEFFRTSFATDNPLITEAIRRMLAAGGKRLRPRLTLVAVSAVGGGLEDHLPLAAFMELIHVATLIHDDVVDQAEQRRGVNATAVDFGNRISVLAGDYLFAWIFKNVTANYPAPVPHILSATLAAICDGEVLQLRSLDNLDLSVDAYTEIIRKKTASLFLASARCGAIVGGGSTAEVEALSDFGDFLGTAFQMRDDLLDFVADAAELGKPVGHDLIEHKVTLPVIAALELSSPAGRTAIENFYHGVSASPADAIDVIRSSGALERTQAAIVHTVDQALATVEIFPAAARAELSALLDSVRYNVLEKEISDAR